MKESAPEKLRRVRQGLLHLHKALLENERETYERAHGRIESNYQLLHLVMVDPWFAWLHRLSELVVQVDEVLDSEEAPSAGDADNLIDQARVLISPSGVDGDFQRKYSAAMQSSPDVVLAHGQVVKAFSDDRS